MAKCIIDIDALIKCCDFLSEGKLNDRDYTYVQNVKALIARFPKEEVKESVVIKVEREITV